MKTIIENLQALVDSIEFAETEYKANYVIETQDKKLLTEALNEALRIHSVMQAEGSDGAKEAAVGQRSVDTVAEGVAFNCVSSDSLVYNKPCKQWCGNMYCLSEAPSGGQP